MPARLNAVRKTGRMVSRRLMRRNSTAAMRFADAFSRFPALAGLIGTAIAVSMAALSFAALWQGRAQALQNANQAAANLVATLSADIARNVESSDLSLRTIVSGVLPEIRSSYAGTVNASTCAAAHSSATRRRTTWFVDGSAMITLRTP